jgi:glucose-6-phosphate 1-dehydrogenase
MHGAEELPAPSDPAVLSRAPQAPPCHFVIFGAGGDLTRRLLMPALYNLRLAGLLDDGFRIIGVDVRDMDDGAFRAHLTEAMTHFVTERRGDAGGTLDQVAWNWMSDRTSYLKGDFDDPATFERLRAELPNPGNVIFYCATAARFFEILATQLHAAALTVEAGGFRRLVVEKPFGHDLASARALNVALLRCVEETQIYRIDHYLGKETVQNIMALRFSNGIFEPIWTRDNIDHVQITAAETVGVEQRGKFYEGTGAMRDMVPNHIFQLLSMVAMEAPTSFDADAVRTEKAKVLQAIHPPSGRQAVRDVVRGQYRTGQYGTQSVPGYRHEPDVDHNSSTETYIAMKLAIDNWRWAGVPFYIRTGKRMARRHTEISIHFKQAPFALFRDTPVEKLTPNIMFLHIQPTEGVTLQFSAKVPGPRVNLGGVTMNFNYADYFHEGPSTGYETLLYDCLTGDATLFQRADNVEAGWNVVQPALDAWEDGHIHVHPYAAGTDGPEEANALLRHDGRSWVPIGSGR